MHDLKKQRLCNAQTFIKIFLMEVFLYGAGLRRPQTTSGLLGQEIINDILMIISLDLYKFLLSDHHYELNMCLHV